MANMKKTKFPVRLQMAAEDWFVYTENMRKARSKMLKHYAAGWYDNAEAFSQPLNLIDRGVQILAPFLVSNNPKVMVDAKRGIKINKPFARTFELALEYVLNEIRFAQNTLRPLVINSLFSMGITKTGICKSDIELEVGGYWHDTYQPYCDNIDFEDYIGDVAARRREEMDFEGHRYRVDFDFVRECGLFKNIDGLKPLNNLYSADTKPEMIAKKDARGWEYRDIHPKTELIDLWIPKENIIVTIPPRGQGTKILRTVEYEGPEGGPYDILGYRYFPDSIVPIPPVWTWLDLNNVINKLVARMRTQAERQKDIVVYGLGAAEDAERIRTAKDGDVVGIRNTDEIKPVSFGGPNESLYPFVQYLEQQYSITGGNLYIIGGRQSQAETLGQEQMLQANASKQLEDMVERVQQVTKNIIQKIAWYVWSDPAIQIPVIKEAGGIKIEEIYSKDAQEGDFLDYNFDIEPYSLQKLSPEMRYQRLLQLVSQIVLPTAQMSAAQGNMLNVDGLLEEFVRFLDVRNKDSWYSSSMPQNVEMNGYQPLANEKNGQEDGRFTQKSGAGASNFNNQIQQQSNQKPSSSGDSGKTTAGMQ